MRAILLSEGYHIAVDFSPHLHIVQRPDRQVSAPKGKRTVHETFPTTSYDSSLCSPQTETFCRFSVLHTTPTKVSSRADQHNETDVVTKCQRTGRKARKEGVPHFQSPPLPLRHSTYPSSPTHYNEGPGAIVPNHSVLYIPKVNENSGEDLRSTIADKGRGYPQLLPCVEHRKKLRWVPRF